MKSKKARARLAAEEAAAKAKLDLVEGYKDHFRTMLGVTDDDLAPLAGLPGQHDHVYQTPTEWANAQRPLLDFSHLERRYSLQEQTAQAFSQLGRGWEQFASRILRTGNTVTGRATSQRPPELPPARPITPDDWNSLLTTGLNERLRLTETPLGRMTIETFEDMTIYGVTAPPEEEP